MPSMFDGKSLHDAVNAALKSEGIAEGKNAFVVAATKGGLKGVYSHKVNNVWTVDSYFSVAGTTKPAIDAGVSVKAVWD